MSSDRALREYVNRFAGITALVFAGIVLLGVAAGVAVKKINEALDKKKRNVVVMTVGSTEITAEEFDLFCLTVINGDDFGELKNITASENALAEAVKQKARDYAAEYVILTGEAKKAGVSAVSEAESSEDEAFYYKNFGVGPEKYKEIADNWASCEELLKKITEEAENDEAFLEEAFEENRTRLAEATCSAIFIKLPSADEGVAKLKKSEAQRILEELNNCGEEELSEKFREAADSYGDENNLIEDGIIVVSETVAELYPDFFNLATGEFTEEFLYAEDGGGIFIFRITEQRLFDYYRDTEELRAVAKEYRCKKLIEDAEKSGEYEPETTEAYDEVDVKRLLKAGKN